MTAWSEDYFTHTEADAGEWERHRAEPDDDRPTLAELNAEEHEDESRAIASALARAYHLGEQP